jgi:hypothetical protein
MKQLIKPQYLIAIMAVLLTTVSVVWLWVATFHANYHKAFPNETLHLGQVPKTSISSNPLSEEARQLEAKRLANWKENFPWKPTHDPTLIFDASQPYNYLLTYDISKVTQEKNRRIYRLWERRGQTESSIGRSHWFLRGFFKDDIRFTPQFQALVNGEEQLLTPYVGWYQESAMLEAEQDGKFRIHDASVWTFIQRDPESNPPARVELGRLVDHWGEPVEQCDSLKVSIINGENELIPVEVDADGFITIPTPQEIKRLRKNGGIHKAGPDEPLIAMDPKARRAEAERLAHWKINFPWKPTHDTSLTFDPSQPYLYLHGVSGSHLTPEKKVEKKKPD